MINAATKTKNDRMIRFFTRPLAINLLLGLPALILLIWIVISEYQQFQQTTLSTNQDADRAAAVYASQIHTRLLTQFIELEFIGTNLLDEETDPTDLSPRTVRSLKRFMDIHPDFYALNILSADGSKILWSSIKQSQKPIVEANQFNPLEGHPDFLLGESKFATRFGGYFLAMRYRVKNPDGGVRFFVGSPYRLTHLMAFDLKNAPWVFRIKDTRSNKILGEWRDGVISTNDDPSPLETQNQAKVIGTPLCVDVYGTADLAWQRYQATAWQRWILEFSLMLFLGAVSLLTRRLLHERAHANQHLQRFSQFNRMLAEINQVIADAEDENQLFDQICKIGIDEGQLALMWVGRPDEQGVFKFLAAAGRTEFLNGLRLSIDPDHYTGQGFCIQTWNSGRPFFSTDPSISPFPCEWQERARAFGLWAVASLPLRRDGEIQALLVVYYPEARDLTEFQPLFEELAEDISRGLDRLELIKRERMSSAFNRAILDNSSAGIMLLHNRIIKFANQRLADLIGAASPQDLVNRPTRDYYYRPEDQAHLLKLIPEAFAKGEQVHFEAQFRRVDNGEIRWFSLTGQAFNLPGFDETWMITDITEYHEALSQQRLLASALAAIQEGVVITDNQQHIIYVNAAFTAQTGLALPDIQGASLADLLGHHSPNDIRSVVQKIQNEGKSYRGQTPIKQKDGREFWSLMTINPVINESNQRTNFVCVLRDITAMRRLNERLEYQSLHDPLTHLLNRRALEKTLEERVHQARLTNQPLAVGMLDLDDFKPVNDTYGHEAGDRLLKLVSQRLSERLREHDVLARIGGDEFVIIIGYLDDGNLAQQLQRILERLHEAIETPFEIEEGQLAWVGMSMGVALYPDDGAESDLLLRRADAALYRAKTHKHTQDLWWRRWIEESNSAKPLNP